MDQKQRRKERSKTRSARYRDRKKSEWENIQRENLELGQQVLVSEMTLKSVLDYLFTNDPEQWLAVQPILHRKTTEQPMNENVLWDKDLFADLIVNADCPNTEFEEKLDIPGLT